MRARKIFLGWWVVFAMGFAALTTWGIGQYGFYLFLKPLQSEFDWGRATASGAISISWASAPLIFLVSSWTETYGPRRLMLLGTALEAASLLLFSQIHVAWQLYVLRVLMGAGLITVATPMPIVVCRWFERRQGLVMSIVYASFQLGGLVMAPLMQSLINRVGWRPSVVVLALGLLTATIPIVAMFMTDRRPEELGLRPDGGHSRTRAAAMSSVVGDSSPSDIDQWQLNDVTRTPMFWAVLLLTILFYFAQSTLWLHQSAFITDLGISSQAAANLLGLTSGIYIIGAVGAGFAIDRAFSKASLAGLFVLQLLAVIALSSLSHRVSWGVLIAYTITFSISNGAGDVTFLVALRKWFGKFVYHKVYAIWYFLTYLTYAAAPPVAGWVYDRTGDYMRVFELILAGSSLALVISLLARAPRARLMAAGPAA